MTHRSVWAPKEIFQHHAAVLWNRLCCIPSNKVLAVLSEIEAPSHEQPAAYGPCSCERLSISSLMLSEVQRTRGINSLCVPKGQRSGGQAPLRADASLIINHLRLSTCGLWWRKCAPPSSHSRSSRQRWRLARFSMLCWKLQVIARDVFFGPNNARLYTRGVSLLKCAAADGFMPPWRRCLFIYFESSCLRRRFDTPLLFSRVGWRPACGSHALRRCLFVCLQSACVRWARRHDHFFPQCHTKKSENNVSIFFSMFWHGAWEGGSKLSLRCPQKKIIHKFLSQHGAWRKCP
jgi:hypothetical protein